MALCDLIKPRVCELGKIKIGGLGEERQKASGSGTYRMPVKHDYFTVTTLFRDPKTGDLIPDAELMASLKDFADPDGRLRQLPISVLSNEPDDVLQAAYVWYNGRRLAGRSDGVTFTRFFDLNKGWLPQPEVMPWKPEYANLTGPDKKKLFKLHVTLNCVVAAPSARWGGVYKFRSTSQISAEQLYSSLVQLRTLTGGQLRGLPLRLVLRPVQVSPEGVTSVVYVVHIELRGADLQTIQEMALERARFEIANAKQLGALQQEYRALLAAPGEDETPEEAAEIAQEFHPEQQAETASPADGEPFGRVPNEEGRQRHIDRKAEEKPTGGQATSPPPTPESFEQTFGDSVDVAKAEADLDAVVADMRAAFDAKRIDHAARTRLASRVKAKRVELQAAAKAEANGASDPKS